MNDAIDFPEQASGGGKKWLLILLAIIALLMLFAVLAGGFSIAATGDPGNQGIPTIDINEICSTTFAAFDITVTERSNGAIAEFVVTDQVSGGYAEFLLLNRTDLGWFWAENTSIPEAYRGEKIATRLLVAGDDYIRNNSSVTKRWFIDAGMSRKNWSTYKSCWGEILMNLGDQGYIFNIP